MNRQVVLEQLQANAPIIAPSMLKCDFGNLHREIQLLEAAEAPILHLDVMDGHFVPNLSYGPMVIERMRQLTHLPLDAHLMIDDPSKFLDDFLDAGCDLITFHIEAVEEPGALLRRIRSAGVAAGLALNPNTPEERITRWLPECDLVLVMSVEPGFGGQKFIPASIDKLRRLKNRLPENTLLSIDGGIGPATIAGPAAAGADIFVAGSAIFDAADYSRAIAGLAAVVDPRLISSSSEN